MKRSGFTLLELIVVIIIIGLLATLGLTQYGRVIEKSRGAEARTILGSIRSLAASHHLEYNSLTTPAFNATQAGLGTDNDQIPSECRASNYFRYDIATTDHQLTTTATRCGAAGKGGATPSAAKTFTLVTVFPSTTSEPSDTWGGDGGY